MAKFFVSYSRSVKNDVKKVVDLLNASGHEVWWDGDIPIMADWWATILQNIEWCDIFIFVTSEKSVQSAYCIAELKYANDRQCPILPFILDDPTQYSLPSELPARNQWLMYNGDPAQMLSQINYASNNINWDLFREIDAPRPPEPMTGGKSLAKQFQEARQLANDKDFDTAKQQLRNIKTLDYGEWGGECDQWLALLNSYEAVKDLADHNSTHDRAQKRWQQHVRTYGSEFDPHQINTKLSKTKTSSNIPFVPIMGGVVVVVILVLVGIVFSNNNAGAGVQLSPETTMDQTALHETQTFEALVDNLLVAETAKVQQTIDSYTDTPIVTLTPSNTPTAEPNFTETANAIATDNQIATNDALEVFYSVSTQIAQLTADAPTNTPLPTSTPTHTLIPTITNTFTPTITPSPTVDTIATAQAAANATATFDAVLTQVYEQAIATENAIATEQAVSTQNAIAMQTAIAVPTLIPQGGEVTLLYWQAVSILNPYLSWATKDRDAATLILEPLANIAPDGELIPVLAEHIPTQANGGIASDFTSVTWTIKSGVLWSDGSPLTVNDFIFTWRYCADVETGCVSNDYFENVNNMEAIGANQLKITFSEPNPFPYKPFVSQSSPVLQQAQFANCIGANAGSCDEQNFAPIGTGPFIVEEFHTNDEVTYVRNFNYREAGRPGFDRVIIKGGSDAESTARAVLETGEADYAWNLSISPAVLSAMEAAGHGKVVVSFGSNVERLLLNQTDPSPNNPNRSQYMNGSNPHPFLTIPEVAQAMSMAIDRNIIVNQLYGYAGQVGCNIINAPSAYVSETYWGCSQDINGANALLDEVGIVDTDGDGIREVNGVPLHVTYQTSTNAVRQSTQVLIKQWWADIGIEVELRNISAAVFFGGDPASPDTYQKFYTDVEMFTSGLDALDIETFMVRWLCGNDPNPNNNWLGNNIPRYCDPTYDAIHQELTRTTGIEARANLVKQLNDLVIESGAIIPLVHRGNVSAHANSLGGVEMNPWDSELWNIENWYRIR